MTHTHTARVDEVIETEDSFDSRGTPVRVERIAPARGGPTAAVLLLHGADGLHSRGTTYRRMARQLADHGYLTLLVHYFDSTGNIPASPFSFLRWLAVVGDALDYAGQQPGLAGRPVGLVGFSLGAYLALTVAAQDRRVGAVVDCFGGLPDVFPEGVRAMAPVLILHGEDDPVVPVAEAYRLEQVLRDNGLPYEMHVYPGQGHTFHGYQAQDAFDRARDFLDRHLPAGEEGGTPVAHTLVAASSQ